VLCGSDLEQGVPGPLEKVIIFGCFLECASLSMVVIVQMEPVSSAYVCSSSYNVFIYQQMYIVVDIKPEAPLLSEMSCGRVNGSVVD
jgi:hypothetical protein